MTGPVLVPGDPALADLRLLLRGVRLPLDVLGGRATTSAATAERGVRVRVPADLAQESREAACVVLADEESKPLAALTDATVVTADDGGAVLAGVLQPTEPAAWAPLATAVPGSRQVVVAERPLLRADADELVRLARRGPVVVAVPAAGPSRDGVPPALLQKLVTAATTGIEEPVTVVPVDLYQRDPVTDAALADAVARALGADGASRLTAGDDDWARLLTALDGDEPLPDVADDEVLRALRRWRPPLARRGLVVLLTGLSGAGKSTLATALVAQVRATTDRTVTLLDGDRVRRLLSAGLGFDRASRDLNVRRIGFVAAEVARHGGIAVCAPIAPYSDSRAAVRAMAREVGDFALVHVHAPLAEVERRDVKGLYARARAGLVPGFTGVSDPYEEPTDADLVLDTSTLSVEEALARLVDLLESRGWIPRAAGQEN